MKYTHFFLFALLVVAIILRFYNLDWGSPFYFHPDERNIASSITQLHFPHELNPHFFAYGSLPLYVIFFTGLFSNLFLSCHFQLTNCDVSFSQAIIIGRIYSALFSLLLIPLLYYVGQKLASKRAGIIAAFLGLFSVGFIQFAHFETFEMWLTFFGMLYFYTCILLLARYTKKRLLTVAILLGILLSIKVSNLLFLPLFLFSFLVVAWTKKHAAVKTKVLFFFLGAATFSLIAAFILLLTSPYYLFDFSSFMGSMRYESGVATGTQPVFYTQGFIHAIPIVFQFLYIYPFLINPLLTILFIAAFVSLLARTIQTRNPMHILLLLGFFITFAPQAFLFAKWTRYMIPTLPFIYLILGIWLEKTKKVVSILLIALSSIFAFSYLTTAFVQEDSRTVASKYAASHIPHTARIASELYDLGIVPFNADFESITLLNFYDIEKDKSIQEDISQNLSTALYFISPSQRILKDRLTYPLAFPKGYQFYKNIVSKSGEFKKIYVTPCDVWCKITYMGDPIFNTEITTNVFDRPTVFIFKKQ